MADFYIARDMETEGGWEGKLRVGRRSKIFGPHGREEKERFKRANVSDLKRGGGAVSSSVRFPICAKEEGGGAIWKILRKARSKIIKKELARGGGGVLSSTGHML